MNGYNPWMIERSPSLDFVPILADGTRLMTYLKKPRVFWSIGYFNDFIGESESFATANHQVSGRLVWQPLLSDDNATVLHVGASGRTFQPDNDVVRIKSKPENNLAPQVLDTGSIPSKSAQTYGVEMFYRKGAWLAGTEWNWEKVHAEPSGDPVFRGGNAVVTWNITGETRAYNATGAFFAPVSPKRTVFEGGPGAFEAVLNFSFCDYDSGPYAGGKMWRITPMMNWIMSDNVRLEFVYGYSKVDRFGLEGGTSFFQARTQFSL
jgi:phosphate-selective porin OprO/OprP